jgi:hypothetical protein
LEVFGKHKKLESTSFYADTETLRNAGKMTPALIGGAALAPALIVAGIEAIPAVVEAAPYAIRAAYLNAPAIYGSAVAYGGAVATGVALAQHLVKIRNEGFHLSDIPQLAEDLLPLVSGYLESQSFSPSRATPKVGDAESVEPELVISYSRQQGNKVVAGITDLRSGRTYDAEIDPMSRNGQIVDRASRQVIGIIRNGEIMRPSSGVLGTGSSAPAGPPSVAPSQAVLPGSKKMPALPPGQVTADATRDENAKPANVKAATPPTTTGGVSPRTVNAPGSKATLPIQPFSPEEPTFKSVYKARPTWIDPEGTAERSVKALASDWQRKPVVKHPGSGRLMSTVPELLSESLGVAVEVKNVSIDDFGKFYPEWAEQLARRNATLSRTKQRPIQNWLFLDLRGTSVEVDLLGLRSRIQAGVGRAGATGGRAGGGFDKVYFILDTRVVEMP